MSNQLSPVSGAKFKTSCEVCGHKFVAVYHGENMNSYHKKIIDSIRDSHTTQHNLFYGPTSNVISLRTYMDVEQLRTVCPNCGNENEIGQVPTGRTSSEIEQFEIDMP